MKGSIVTLIFLLILLFAGDRLLPKRINVPVDLSFLTPTVTPSPTISPTPLLPSYAKVATVIDGDTVKLENGEIVRYIGIDTPETKHPTKGVQCFGKEASEKNKVLVEGKIVRLEKDVSETDRYGRLLRYVYIEHTTTNSALFVNDYLVREGYAFAATFPPDVTYAEQFHTAQQEARMANKGLWKNCAQ